MGKDYQKNPNDDYVSMYVSLLCGPCCMILLMGTAYTISWLTGAFK